MGPAAPGDSQDAFGGRFTGAAAILLALFAVGWTWWRSGLFGSEIGNYEMMLGCIHRIASGQVVYRDFDCWVTPLTFMVHAGLHRLLGANLAVTRACLSLEAALTSLLVLFFLRRRVGLGLGPSLLAATTALFWCVPFQSGIPWYNNEANLFALLAGMFLMDPAGVRGPGAFWTGIFCGLSFWSKQDIGGAAILAGGAICAGEGWRAEAHRWRPSLLFGAGLFIPFLLFGVYFACAGAAGSALQHMVVRAIRFKLGGASLGRRVWLAFFSPRNHVGKILLFLYALPPILVGVFRRRQDPVRMGAVRACIFGGLVSLAGVVRVGDGANFDMQQSCLGLAIASDCLVLTHPGARAALVALTLLLDARSLHYACREFWGERQEGFLALNHPRYGGLRLSAQRAQSLNAALTRASDCLSRGGTFDVLPPASFFGIHFALATSAQHRLAVSDVDEEVLDWTGLASDLKSRRVDELLIGAEFHRALGAPKFRALAGLLRDDYQLQAQGPGFLVFRRMREKTSPGGMSMQTLRRHEL